MEKNTTSNLIIIYFCLIVLFGFIIYYCKKCYDKIKLNYDERNSKNNSIQNQNNIEILGNNYA